MLGKMSTGSTAKHKPKKESSKKRTKKATKAKLVPQDAHVIEVKKKVKHVKRKPLHPHHRPHIVRKVRTVYVGGMPQESGMASSMMKILAPIVICLGVLILILYLLYDYASSAICNIAGPLLSIVGFCKGSSGGLVSDILGTGIEVGGKVIEVGIDGGTTVVDGGTDVACGIFGC